MDNGHKHNIFFLYIRLHLVKNLVFLPTLASNLDFHTCSLESAMRFKGGIEQTIQSLKQETDNKVYLRAVFAAKNKSDERKTGAKSCSEAQLRAQGGFLSVVGVTDSPWEQLLDQF